MKSILLITISLVMFACAEPRDVQTEMVAVRLIKIDTVFRYDSHPRALLTWRGDDNVNYTAFTGLNNEMKIGSQMVVLVTR